MKKNTKNKKLKIAVVFGGKSVEHEVSLKSAFNIYSALDKKKYIVELVSIDKSGVWRKEKDVVVNTKSPKIDFNNFKPDVVFPIIHGAGGEDGTIQGFLKILNIPFVGCDVLASIVSFDKDYTKRILNEKKILNSKYLLATTENKIDFKKAKKELGLPMFIKPSCSGSSVGVSKVTNEKEYVKAYKDAFMFDHKILIEEAIVGRELECAVLGNEGARASCVGEVITTSTFYSYDAKYLDANASRTEIPAQISKKEELKIQKIAIDTYRALSCEGLSRVDVFLKKNGEVVVNEVNTMPGFTNISMYPKLWEKSGISYSKLIDELINLALKREEKAKMLKTSY